MTFAELVIKFESQGNDKVLRDVRSIEVQMQKLNGTITKNIKISVDQISKLSQIPININTNGLKKSNSDITDSLQTLTLFQLALKDRNVESFSKLLTSAFTNVRTVGLEKRIIGLKDKLSEAKKVGDALGVSISRTSGGGVQTNISGFTTMSRLADQIKIQEQLSKNMREQISLEKKIGQNLDPKNIELMNKEMTGILSTAGMIVSTVFEIAKAFAVALSAVYAFNAALIKSTVESAFEVEQLQARLGALTTPEKATDILSFVRQLAEPSNFTTKQLAEASVQLEAFGLNSKRILPIMAQLGMAFGADAEKLRLLTDMFGRLSQGQLPDQQVMAQFGISKSKLMKEGVKFDSQGSLVSSTRSVMIAIEKIVTRDYGKIFDKMAQTGNAKLASLTDVFERLKVSIGQSLMDTAKNAISGMTNLLSAIERTGIMQKVAQSMLLPFQAIANVFTGKDKSVGNIQQTMATWAGGLLAIFEEINIQTALFVEQFARAVQLAVAFQGGNLFKVAELVPEMLKGARGQFAPSRAIQKGTDYSMMILDELQKGTGGVDIKDLIDKSKLTDFGKLEDLLKNDKEKKDKSQRTLDLIQQNTKTQNEITLRNLTYGGGELAAQGLSAVQMSGFRSVSSPGINASNDIVRGVEKIVRGYSNSNNLNFSFKRS
jgi:hypothetical protein